MQLTTNNVSSLMPMWTPLADGTKNNHYWFDKEANTFKANWFNGKDDSYNHAEGLLIATRRTFVILQEAIDNGTYTSIPEFNTLFGRVKPQLEILADSYQGELKEMVQAINATVIENVESQLSRFFAKPDESVDAAAAAADEAPRDSVVDHPVVPDVVDPVIVDIDVDDAVVPDAVDPVDVDTDVVDKPAVADSDKKPKVDRKIEKAWNHVQKKRKQAGFKEVKFTELPFSPYVAKKTAKKINAQRAKAAAKSAVQKKGTRPVQARDLPFSPHVAGKIAKKMNH